MAEGSRFTLVFTAKASRYTLKFLEIAGLVSTCLVFGGNLGNDLDNSAFELLNADVLKDDCSLGEQPHICGYFFTLQPQQH